MDVPSDTDLFTARSELDRLESYRRWTYIAVLLLAVTIIMVSWLFRKPADPFVTLTYPVVALALGILCVLFYIARLPVRQLEIASVAAVAALVMGRLSWHFYYGDPLNANLLVLVGGHYWAVAILMVGSFIALGYKGGVIVGAATFLYSGLLAVVAVLDCYSHNAAGCGNWVYLFRIHLFLAVLLALTSAGTLLRDKTLGAFARAELLQQWATTDQLSGLANRRGADNFLSTEAALADRYNRPLSVILMDVDNFKDINDSHGHELGDKVITSLAIMLTETLREVDLVARWGGDEFLIATPGIGLEDARQAAERCRKTVEKNPVCGIRLTTTYGIAQYRRGRDIDDAIRRADQMLYRAKSAGRNRVMAEAGVVVGL